MCKLVIWRFPPENDPASMSRHITLATNCVSHFMMGLNFNLTCIQLNIYYIQYTYIYILIRCQWKSKITKTEVYLPVIKTGIIDFHK